MKRVLTILLATFAATHLFAQQEKGSETGWSFSPMPIGSYNSDLGLSIGAYSSIFYYGDGTDYPNFIHQFFVTGAWATKGSWFLHGMFDSSALIPGVRVTASLTFRDVSANNFYGFNGIASPFDPMLELNRDTRTAYYTNSRNVLKAAAVFQSKGKGKVNWMGGLVFRRIRLKDFTLSNYDSGNSLYLAYQEAGLIRSDEAGGGNSLELKAGATYDSRDVEIFPGKGLYGELYLNGNFDLSYGKYHYLQLAGQFCHFVPIVFNRLTLAYHLGFQHQLLGEMPFYNLSELSTLRYQIEEYEGLGSRNSIRGFRYNRILAAGYAWSNIELRATVLDFRLFKQDVALVVVPFVDLGVITRHYRLEEQKSLPGFYQQKDLPLMASVGIGGKLHINTNTILSVDFGKALDPQLGFFTISTASTYIF